MSMLRIGLAQTICRVTPELQGGTAARLVVGSGAWRPAAAPPVFRTPVRATTSGSEAAACAPWYARHPVAVAVDVAAAQTAAADVLIQRQIEKMDYARVVLFTALGAGFFSAWQYVSPQCCHPPPPF